MAYADDVAYLKEQLRSLAQRLAANGENPTWEVGSNYQYAVNELRAELSPGHTLFSCRNDIICVAKCLFQDDYLFYLPHIEEWAIVHLVFDGAQQAPPYPRTALYPTVRQATAAMGNVMQGWGFRL